MPAIDDPLRLEVLRASRVLELAPDAVFDHLAQLAAALVGAPIALLSIIDDQRQVWKGQCGLTPPWSTHREAPLTHSFCPYVVRAAAAYCVDDARTDAALRELAAVRELGFVAYAGVPVQIDGKVVGALCAIDAKPRHWEPRDLATLHALADLFPVLVGMRRRDAGDADETRRLSALLAAVLQSAPIGVHVLDRLGTYLLINQNASAHYGAQPSDVISKNIVDFVPMSVANELLAADAAARLSPTPIVLEQTFVEGGRVRHYRATKVPLRAEHGFGDAVATFVLETTEQRSASARLGALARTGAILTGVVDEEVAFHEVATLLVPVFADWCSLWLRLPDGRIELAGQRHIDSTMDAQFHEMAVRFPPLTDAASGTAAVFRTGRPELVEQVNPHLLRSLAANEEHLGFLTRLQCCSYVLTPVITRDQVVGVIGLFMSSAFSGRRFSIDDGAFAREIASRLALAIENARLFKERSQAIDELRAANERLEERVAERTAQLEKAHRVLEQQAADLRQASLSDELTGLSNRRGFLLLAEQQLQLATRNRTPFMVFFVDLNGMKQINDTFGHEMGDRALVDTAALLRRVFRKSDVVARLGGDEFVALATIASADNVAVVAKRLDEAVADYNATTPGFHLSLSLGTAIFDPSAPRSIEHLLSEADTKMYEVKRSRRTAPG